MTTRLLLLALFLITAACSNVLRSGLMNDSSILLPPNHEKTIYVQVRNTSENQLVTPADLAARLSAKGYQVVADPQQAAYWIQTQIVYCHKPGDDVTPEAIAKSGFGSGLGSGGTPLHSAGGGDLMGSLKAQNAMMAQAMKAMMAQNAMMAQAMRGGGGAPKPEGIAYLCVADVLMTERGKGVPAVGAQLKTYKMRSVAHILQKDVNIEEATPILRDKLSTGITGVF